MLPAPPTNRRRIIEDRRLTLGNYILVANQITATTIPTRIAAHTTGATFFELPLRGESFVARLNSLLIRR